MAYLFNSPKIENFRDICQTLKCMIHELEVEFLGYIISCKRLSMDLKKFQTILD